MTDNYDHDYDREPCPLLTVLAVFPRTEALVEGEGPPRLPAVVVPRVGPEGEGHVGGQGGGGGVHAEDDGDGVFRGLGAVQAVQPDNVRLRLEPPHAA